MVTAATVIYPLSLHDAFRSVDSALFNDAEDSAFDHGIEFESANQMMTLIAYELIYQAIMLTLNDKFNKQEAA